MSALRPLVVAVMVIVAVTVQLGVLPMLIGTDVVPNLVLILVIAVALSRGPESGALAGFVSGLALDLAPPADHTAGRWALAFVVVGHLAGMARRDSRVSAIATVVIVAAGSFIGTSLFALSGLVLGDEGITITGVLYVVPLAVLYDVILTPFVVPLVLAILRRLEPVAVRLQA